jgi:hypothetical protein
MTACDELTAVEKEEFLVQQGVLTIVLEAYPAQQAIDEVVRQMTEEIHRPLARERIENAIRDLFGVGLVHLNGAFVFATLAAVRFDELRN